MFFLGIVTSLSPCSVALLLAMFSYVMTARRKEEYLKKSASASKEGFMIGVAFTLGMAMVFFVVGLFLSDIGVFIRQARFFDLAAGLLMVILGINIIKPIGEIIEPVRSRLSFRKADADGDDDDSPVQKKGIMERLVHFSMGLFEYSAFIGAFTLGVFFALGWAPCAVSLVFPVLIWLISQDVTPLGGALMLFVFGVGHGVPVIPIATFSRAVGGQIGEKYISAGKYVTQDLRAGGDRDRPDLRGEVPGVQDVVRDNRKSEESHARGKTNLYLLRDSLCPASQGLEPPAIHTNIARQIFLTITTTTIGYESIHCRHS